MSDPYLGTNILIRFLTGDDPKKQRDCAELFEKISSGSITVEAPDTVIADAVFVLSSPRLYRKSPAEVAALLLPIVALSHFRIKNRSVVQRALELYGQTSLDFGDTMILASMKQSKSQSVYSYDTVFDRVPDLRRIEP